MNGKNKKIITLLLTLAMVLSVFVFSASAEVDVEHFDAGGVFVCDGEFLPDSENEYMYVCDECGTVIIYCSANPDANCADYEIFTAVEFAALEENHAYDCGAHPQPHVGGSFKLEASQSEDHKTVTVYIKASDIPEFTGVTFSVEFDSAVMSIKESDIIFAKDLDSACAVKGNKVSFGILSSSDIDLTAIDYLAVMTFTTIKSGDSKLELVVKEAISKEMLLVGFSVDCDDLIVNIPVVTTAPPTTLPPTTKAPITTDNTPSQLIIAEDADMGLVVDHTNKTIKNVPAETAVTSFLAQFENKNVVAKNADGNTISGDAKVTTGSTFDLRKYNGSGESTGIIYTAVILGDVNCDGSIKTNDARLALRAAVKIDILEGVRFAAANISGGTSIKASDARKILRVAVKIDQHF